MNLENKAIVYLSAGWCGPCKIFGPIIEETMKNFPNINYNKLMMEDDIENFATKYSIKNVPTVLFFNNGEVVDKKVGMGSDPKIELEEHLKALLTIEDF